MIFGRPSARALGCRRADEVVLVERAEIRYEGCRNIDAVRRRARV
jgi:hypothetical protein